jgi:hypothetical protein
MKHIKLFESDKRSLYEVAQDTFSYLLDDKEIRLENRHENVVGIRLNNIGSQSSLEGHIRNLSKIHEVLSDIKVGIEQLKIEFEDIKYKYFYYTNSVCIIIYYGEYRFSE